MPLFAGVMLLVSAATVKPGGAPLRVSCEASAAVVAHLEGGRSVELRFSLSGDLGQCYKVQAGPVAGYLRAGDLDDTASYEAARAAAPSLSSTQLIRSEIVRLRETAREIPSSAGIGGVLQLLESSQPKQALELLETRVLPAQRTHTTLALAGVAAFQSDDPRRAVDYLTEALRDRKNPQLEELLTRAQRELAGDRSSDRTPSRYFTLRYDGAHVSSQVASELAQALDEEFEKVSGQLGCRAGEKITAIVQSAGSYRAATGAAEWTGGQFDGRIRIPLLYENGRAGPRLRQAFAHEIVHACVAQFGPFPAWFHEGLAQKLSGESLPRALWRSESYPPLDKLQGSWGSLTADGARLAYQASLAAVELLLDQYGFEQVRSLLRRPEALAAITPELSRRLTAR